MGSKRQNFLKYDAMIGVAGSRPDKGSEEIAGRLTWVGIGPKKLDTFKRGPILSFDRFNLLNGDGPCLSQAAPDFWNWMEKGLRRAFRDSNNLPFSIRSEILALVDRYGINSPSRFEIGECNEESGRCGYANRKIGTSSSQNSALQSSLGKRSCK
ncbi:MAG: hypothetical protein OXF84_04400 [Bacteroidetes bacterium]|nr:hypothetical protein [Bacteroidota bacterium]